MPTPDQADAARRAQYLAFSTCWEESFRMSQMPRRTFEARVITLFRRLCRRIEPGTVLEIGAHAAEFSRWAAEALPAARVVAFEANPYAHAKYAGAMSGTRAEYHHLAVGPVTGEIELNLPREVRGRARTLTSPMASLRRHTLASETDQVQVPCVRLDEFVALGAGDRAVAWIDVEGASGPVLESGPEVLGHLDAAYIEVERETTWEGQWLDTDVVRHLGDHGLVPIARDVAKRRHQFNLVFVRDHLLEERWVPRPAARLLADLARA